MPLTSSLTETFFIKRVIYVALCASVISASIDLIASGKITNNNIIDLLIVGGLVIALVFLLVGKTMLAGVVGGMLLTFLMSGEIIMAQFLKPGSTGVILVLGMLSSLVFKGIYRLIVHGVVVLSLCTALGYLVYIDVPFPDNSSMVGNAINILIIYALIAITSSIIKHRYDDSIKELIVKNDELKEAKMEIENKQVELSKSVERVNSLNSQLEKMVEDKTVQIRKQNDLLVQHAFANAHHIRGPLARILGLARLNSMDPGTDHIWLLAKIEEEANELDAIVQNIDSDLNGIID